MSNENTNSAMLDKKIPSGLHVVAKPVGPACNLNCDYCFYLEKHALFKAKMRFRMSDSVLEAFITNYISSQPTPLVDFVWQGGEPTLIGLDFFKKVVSLQKPFAKFKKISNSIQTNGTMLTDEWCNFLKKNDFMVGISLDGPEEIHDRYRRNRNGNGTFDRVMKGLRLLQKHKIEYNVLASVARETAKYPLETYSFFKTEGVEFIQFAPIVERIPDERSLKHGLNLAFPASLNTEEKQKTVTPWSVIPEEYGDFLISIYEEWVHKDVGTTFVMNFEWALNAWLGNPSPICVHAEQCGGSVVIEHNGDVFACDHYVYPEYRLGNIATESLSEMVKKSRLSGFGAIKETTLPGMCRECEVLAACRGGCPKHRFASTKLKEPGHQYMCEGYRKFFLHIRKYLKAITQLLASGLPVSYIMEATKGPLVIKLENKTDTNKNN